MKAKCIALVSLNLGLLISCSSRDENAPAPRLELTYPQASHLDERLAGGATVHPKAPRDRPRASVQDARPPSPAERDELVRRGIEAQRARRLTEAEALYEEAERAAGLGEKGLLASALLLYQKGNYVAAAARARALWGLLERRRFKALDEDLQTSPMREAALVKALIDLKTHDRQQGLLLLERLVAAARTWPLPLVVLSQHYLDTGAPQLAERVAQLGVDRLADASPELHVALARSRRALGKTDAALAALRQGRAAFPEDSALLHWSGVLSYDAGFLTSACEAFALAHARRPDLAEASHNHALCLTQQGQWEQAGSVLKSALAKAPDRAPLHVLLGIVSKRGGRMAMARQAWREFLAIAPADDPQRAFVESALADLRDAGLDGEGEDARLPGPPR